MEAFKTGDTVQWVRTTGGRRTFSMTIHEATVVSVSLGGDIVTVKMKGGKVRDMRASDLSHVGQRTQIDAVVDALRGR